MNVTGGCHCGAIRFEADVDPERVGICHCTDCQRLSGAPYRASAAAPADRVSFSGGEPSIYIKTADSGRKRAQAFCPACGSPLYATGAEDRATLNIRLGAIDQRDQLTPIRQIWCRSAQPWTADLSALPCKQDQ
jgi:hypothetical protein